MTSRLALAIVLALVAGQPAAQELPPYVVVRDAIPDPLTREPGDVDRGRATVANRTVGLCLLCHAAPIPEDRLQGNLAPSLAGTGSRWTAGQLRLRLVDPARLVPDTIMPPYYRLDHLHRVAKAFTGKTILSAQQIEDVVAYLASLKE
jgi:L-cysteine S-thiosulfotransferase